MLNPTQNGHSGKPTLALLQGLIWRRVGNLERVTLPKKAISLDADVALVLYEFLQSRDIIDELGAEGTNAYVLEQFDRALGKALEDELRSDYVARMEQARGRLRQGLKERERALERAAAPRPTLRVIKDDDPSTE